MELDECYAGNLTSPEFKDLTSSNKGVLVVCGSCEQHGHHMALDTDNVIGFELARRIAKKTGLVVMPPVNYGQVWSAKGIPGTVSLKPDTLKLVLRDIVVSLEEQKVANVVLMSGHNGNYAILKELARELRDENGWENVWHFPLAMSKDLMAKAKTLPAMAPHAGEMETAMMLYLRPDLVHLERAEKDYPQPPECYAYRPMHWNEICRVGSFGDPGAATAEYGKLIVDYAVDTTADLINRLL